MYEPISETLENVKTLFQNRGIEKDYIYECPNRIFHVTRGLTGAVYEEFYIERKTLVLKLYPGIHCLPMYREQYLRFLQEFNDERQKIGNYAERLMLDGSDNLYVMTTHYLKDGPASLKTINAMYAFAISMVANSRTELDLRAKGITDSVVIKCITEECDEIIEREQREKEEKGSY